MKSLVFCSVMSLGLFVATLAETRDLSFEQRVGAQKAIEQVYWNHRIWPKENPGPKPPLSAVVPDVTLRAKVQDYLRMSALLDSFWHQPLTGEQLQAEIDRMVRHTKMPETLLELFAALNDDPFLIAECLARPALAQRRVEAAFAQDEQIHGAQRAALTSTLEGVNGLARLESLDGDHSELVLVLDDGAAGSAPPDPTGRTIHLTRDDWNRELGRLAANFDVSQAGGFSTIAVDRLSRIVDHGDRFVVFGFRARSASKVTVASVSWAKRPYDVWAREMATSSTLDASAIAQPARGYSKPMPAVVGCTDDTWTPTAGSLLPTGRVGHTAVWTGTEMIIWGGGDRGSIVNTGGRYDPAIDVWTQSSLSSGSGSNVPGARSRHTAVWTGSEMMVWGGGGGAVSSNTGGRYNPSTDSWAPSSLTTGSGANVPVARSGHTAVWTGTEMIVWGGYGGGFLNTGGRYDPSTDSWAVSSLADASSANVPDGRYGQTAVWTGTEMIIWGGTGAGPSSFSNTGGRYSPTTDAWASSSLTDGSGANVPAIRSSHTAVWTGTEMIVWGGYADGFPNTGGRYDPSTDSWAASSLTDGSGANVPVAGAGHTAVWTGSEMIVWGGDVKTGGRYNPAADTWAASSLNGGTGADVPEAPSGHTALWTGTEMVVWGGYYADASHAAGVYVNTGGRYDPATDTWAASSLSPASGANGPGVRENHTAVWTGSEMIVWGGSALVPLGNPRFNTGGRYDPATDTWAASSLTAGSGENVPSARDIHTAVWTGTEMIVWGGTQTATGGRYNPSTDSWAASSLTIGSGANVPEARYRHTAVWTGTEMVVWGGYARAGPSNISLNSGGRYRPTTDTWAPMSLTNVPSRRDGHSAVWTGTEMIVWGGSNGSASLSSGGRYDPSTDSWAESSLNAGSGANVPTARSGHTAVWTGTEMIVWGGGVNTGGRFSPSTDSWAASSLATGAGENVPAARFGHTAVWTGSEMMVWGGSFASRYLSTGGRYNPFTDSWALSSLSTGFGPNVPTPRYFHTGVWTGSSDHRMIVWGGFPQTRAGGLYCAVCKPLSWYQDLDGDDHGNPEVTQSSCEPPLGYVVAADDCNDADPGIHAGAVEVCNSIDDDCDAVVDNGGGALCNDLNVCTTDACHGVSGCSRVHNTLPCDDGDACTTNDTCSAGACLVGTVSDCDDGLACTSDSCNPSSGCIHGVANLDAVDFSANRVDGRDLVVLADAWNSCPGSPRYSLAANLDHSTTPTGACIDGTDFHLFMISFGHSCP